MLQRKSDVARDASQKDVAIQPSGEECVISMGQRKNFAVVMVAPTKPSTEESVTSMGQSAKLAVVRDVLTMCRREESA